MDNSLKFLGLANKARKLAIGDEAVYSSAMSGKARAVFTARDCSDNSKRRARRYAQDCGAVYADLPYAKSELGEAVGRSEVGMLSMPDVGIAAAFYKKLNGADRETADKLTKKAARISSRTKPSQKGRPKSKLPDAPPITDTAIDTATDTAKETFKQSKT